MKSVPIILYKIEIQDNAEGHFSIEDFDEPVVIQPFPAAKSTLFRLKFNSCSYDDVNGVKDTFKSHLFTLKLTLSAQIECFQTPMHYLNSLQDIKMPGRYQR